ncbi:MAG: glycosyltransferase family 9 protein [Planctomycetes bacterium]|nr:glycosyltransferase family 9 protein [Planctomycetota bacterium]
MRKPIVSCCHGTKSPHPSQLARAGPRCYPQAMREERALVLRPGALGDAIVTLPVLESLTAVGARVTVVGHPVFRLGVECGIAAQFIAFDDARLAGLFAEGGRCELVAGHRIALAYGRNADHTLAWNLARNCGADKVGTFGAQPSEAFHVTDHLLNSLMAMEVKAVTTEPSLRPQGSWLTAARSWLRDRVLSGGFVAVHPGSGGRAKRWSVERFGELARALACPVVWLLGPAEEGDAEARRLGQQVGVVAENLPLATLAGLLAVCRAYVGNDSGVSHLAAAVGAPTVALFGPTDPAMWAPRGHRVAILGGPQAGGLDAISVEQALSAVRAAMSDR